MVSLSKKMIKAMMGGNIGPYNTMVDGIEFCPIGNNYSTPSFAPVYMPFKATLKNFYVMLENSPGVGKGWKLVVVVDGDDTQLVVTISGDGNYGTDLIHAASVNPGQYVTIRTDAVNDPATGKAAWGLGVY